jgi:hypothetical protein
VSAVPRVLFPDRTSVIQAEAKDDDEDEEETPVPRLKMVGQRRAPRHFEVDDKDEEENPAPRLQAAAAQRRAPRNGDTVPDQEIPNVDWHVDLKVVKYGNGPQLEALDNLCYVQDSFGTDIITREPDVEEVAVAIPLESGAEYGLGQLANPLFDSISPFSRSLFGSALQTLDIARWPTIQ